MELSKLFKEFFKSEKTGGIILIFVTLSSILIANSAWQSNYISFWNYNISGHSLIHWINDGLMTIFFLLIGLELEREINNGELSTIKNASLPIFGAIGGVLFPAGIYMFFNNGLVTQSGAGIPMATDIAFAIGILSILGNRVPVSLKVFITALAVIDDLVAIIVIAVFYTSTFSFLYLAIALGILGVLFILNYLKVNNLIPYLIGGAVMWYFMLQSGVHATITGVLLAFAIPFAGGGEKSPSYILQHILHIPVAFIILPIFALANTSLTIGQDWYINLSEANSIGIISGLVLGKPLGIFLFTYLSVQVGLSKLPSDLKWKDILGVGFLGGIGFTMSIFITMLAFDSNQLIYSSKIAILIASSLSATIGLIFLKFSLNKNPQKIG